MIDKLKAAWAWVIAENRWKFLLAIVLLAIAAAILIHSRCNAQLERESLIFQGKAAAEAAEAAKHRAAADDAVKALDKAREEEVKARADADAKRKEAEAEEAADEAEFDRIDDAGSVDDL